MLWRSYPFDDLAMWSIEEILTTFTGDRGYFDSKQFSNETALSGELSLSPHFSATADTYLFTKLVHRIAKLDSFPVSGPIADLGAGSGVPTLLGLHDRLSTSRYTLNMIEIDQNAIATCEKNVRLLNFDKFTQIRNISIQDALQSDELDNHSVILSNPPYLPMPPGDGDSRSSPSVDGGPYGTDYLESILNKRWRSGTILGLAFCSLSHPQRIFQSLGEYKVLFLDAYECPLGAYTSKTENFEYLADLKKQNLAHFAKFDGDRSTFWTFGLALSRKFEAKLSQ